MGPFEAATLVPAAVVPAAVATVDVPTNVGDVGLAVGAEVGEGDGADVGESLGAVVGIEVGAASHQCMKKTSTKGMYTCAHPPMERSYTQMVQLLVQG